MHVFFFLEEFFRGLADKIIVFKSSIQIMTKSTVLDFFSGFHFFGFFLHFFGTRVFFSERVP